MVVGMVATVTCVGAKTEVEEDVDGFDVLLVTEERPILLLEVAAVKAVTLICSVMPVFVRTPDSVEVFTDEDITVCSDGITTTTGLVGEITMLFISVDNGI